ncbi:MAG TPA: TPM domain-containing protein, partial [Phycisphaerae bacterium]|nr:TPM domain-containing protein [Phycisphaerae bacterium]
MNSRPTWIGVLLVALAVPPPGYAQQFGRDSAIIDEAGVIDGPTQNAINRCLLELEQKTGAQVRVLVINSTNGRDIHDYAIEVAKKQKDQPDQEKSGLGEAGKDNGVLIVVAVKDRRYRFEVGEGLEGTLPDLYCDSIAQKCFVPYFRRGDYSGGVYQGVVAVAQKIAQGTGVQLEGKPAKPVQQPISPSPVGVVGAGAPAGVSCCVVLFPLLVFFIIIVSIASRRGRYYRTWGYGGYGGGGFWPGLFLGQMLGGWGGQSHGCWGGGSSWGGGFGGGGFGGGG